MSYLDPALKAWVIDAVGVVASGRGKGVGRAMVGHALKLAKGSGADRLQLSVDVQNGPAQGLYRSMGFQEQDGHDVYEIDLQSPK